MASARTSGRQRELSKNYSVDAFDGLDLDDETADDNVPSSSLPLEDDSAEDADFQSDVNASPEPLDDDLSNLGDFDEFDDDEDGDDGDAEREYYDDDESVADFSDAGTATFRTGRASKTEWSRAKKASRVAVDPRFQPRGLLEVSTRGSKRSQRLYMFGPTPEDQAPPMKGHYKWRNEPTIPSRKPNNGGFGGMKTTFSLTDQQLKQEADEGWDWYEVEGGKEAFQAGQTSSRLSVAEGQTYMPSFETPPFSFVMGPYQEQRLFTLPVGSFMNLNEAWFPTPPASGERPLRQDPRSRRDGWVINLGQKVQCLDWAPNIEGARQFVAVSTVPVVDTRTGESPSQTSSAPAFTPQRPYKSSIQIWEVTANAKGRVDINSPPILAKVICTAWGDITSLKWCPAPRKHAQPSDPATLGLLAGLWGDGAVRILDVSVPPSGECEYIVVDSAAFTTRPPHAVCTCFTWLSSTGIAVGCASGTLGVWDIPASLERGLPGAFAEPVIYASLATTYVLAITSCYPSRPNIVLATTMAGHFYLVDIMDTSSNTILSPTVTARSTRTRMGRTVLVWHDWSQTVLTSDENFTLIAHPIRRIFRQIGCTRYKSSVMSLAVSPVHPFVMAGCVGGEVMCNNPMRRAYESKVSIWNQIWFTHEWRALEPNERLDATAQSEDVAMEGAGLDSDGQGNSSARDAPGIARILEGHKCEQIRLFNTEDAFAHRENGAIYATVHELKSTVVTVAWNPNIHVGGWVAAGMASGLLRIEDVASD